MTGIFGMNVGLPGRRDARGFWVIVGAMLVIAAATLGFFRWRRWL